jgi:hypothetical protein
MPIIDLTRYIAASSGTWTDPTQDKNLFNFTVDQTMSADRLLLRWAGDFVSLQGPLRVRVTVQAENLTVPMAFVSNLVPDKGAVLRRADSRIPTKEGATASTATISVGTTLSESALGRIGSGGAFGLQASTIYSYTLDIAAGHAWPFSLSEQLDSLRLRSAQFSRFEQLGNNLGFRVIIEPLFSHHKLIPVTSGSDLPCDFAVADHPDTSRFFPAACEPCNGSVIGLPPNGSVSLVTPPADGGCVRTRFFNGMFITREDLETEQRYHRLKSRLHNRASGSGVVWGLDVCLQYGRVSVMPGYGVDCCGNDVALTKRYDVDIAALIADPAAASLVRKHGQECMCLLLEYVECPSDPRPVHGDPCSPDASRCEMSRIRESVRLRLVPPCDDNATKKLPITRFLSEVQALQKRFPLDKLATASGATLAPFTLQITAISHQGAVGFVTVRPSSSFDNSLLSNLIGLRDARKLEVQVILDSAWSFIGGKMSGQIQSPATPQTGAVDPPSPVDLSLIANPSPGPSLKTTFTALNLNSPTYVFTMAGWQAQTMLAAQTDPTVSGDLTFTFPTDDGIGGIATLQSTVSQTQPVLSQSPCDGEPCAPSKQSDSANNRPTSEDPKALVLEALAGLLLQMLARERAGTTSEVMSTRREIAQRIYRLAWLLLFGLSKSADTAALGGSLQKLLEEWCDGLPYEGPECCCDPHGVVIGCAVVEGGTIKRIDPFGGRRYVVHYPLLAHWAEQCGIPPLDLTASRFFSKLCCLAGLPALNVDSPDVPVLIVPIGGGILTVGEPRMVEKQLGERIHVIERRKVGTAEMIASAVVLTGTKASDKNSQYKGLVLADFVADQTVTLLVPADT